MALDIGRNDRCPCGSGRKYKQCCLQAHDASDFTWRQLRAVEGRFIPELFELALKEWGGPLLGAALDEFFLWEGVPEGYEETDAFGSFFVPWFVCQFVDDPHDPDRVASAPDESLAAFYLRRHAAGLSSIERAFLEAASTSPLSFYAVRRTKPGREIALHDVLTGDDVVVRERSASQSVSPGALMFTRVVTVEAVSIMVGAAPIVIPPRWHHTVLDFREQFAGGKSRILTPKAVRDLDFELRDLYLEIEDELFHPRLPQLQNTDGDPLVLTTLHYRLRCSPASAFDRLRSLTVVEDAASLLDGATLDAAGALQAVSIPWSKKGNRLHKDWDNTTLGSVDIDGDRFDVHVNSNRRARRIEREIAKRLGADAVLERRVVDSVEKLLEECGRQPRDRIVRADEERLAQQPEVQAYMRQAAERHWNAWLDTRIPALANRTPRQAARTADGRERLEALFAEFAWHGERTPNDMAPNVSALRAALGLRPQESHITDPKSRVPIGVPRGRRRGEG